MPYFDHNATTPPLPAALKAWNEAAALAWQNPSSPYRSAARAHALLEQARERLALLIGGAMQDYIFTSGATEANNAVFAHLARTAPPGTRAAISAVEHPSVIEAAKAWFHGRLEIVSCNKDGVVHLDALDKALNKGSIGIVSLMAANNETGVLQPWADALKMCRAQGVPLHCDATQWIGKLPTGELHAFDFVTCSAHKFGGVKGAGFLKMHEGSGFHGQFGGEQEHNHRAGTENLAAICAMVAALDTASKDLDKVAAAGLRDRDRFETALASALPGAVIIGQGSKRLWNTVLFLAPRHENTRWVAALDKRGFEISTGSACATGSDVPSYVLAAMGIAPEDARRALRISAGRETSSADWDALLVAFVDAHKSLGA